MNTSAGGGFLRPISGQPDHDKQLDLDLQAVVTGITGLDGGLVRRRYQERPPKQPDLNEDWCAIGVVGVAIEGAAPEVEHYGGAEGFDRIRRHEILDVLASFYGPYATGYATMLREGLTVAQNREALYHLSMGFIDVENIVNGSYLQNGVFLKKIDVHFRLRRRVEREYAVLNVTGAAGAVHTTGSSTQGSVSTDVPFKVKE